MASAASPPTPTGGVSASMWAGQPPSRNGWGRNGEPGSAFRGVSRGRPGRGGAGRGGRGGRGGGRAGESIPTRPDPKTSRQNGDQPKDQHKKEAASLVSTSSATSTSDTSSFLPPKPQARPKETKPPARKTSDSKPPRKLPPIVVNPPPAASNTAPPSATTPNRSRRKRSQNKGSSSSVASKKSPSSESSSSLLRAEKSPVITKDLPPHLVPPPPPETPSFDIKHDIDALVERVRAVAMDRPHTPGSHIDWAGEDDDSLPDLDDWGVKNVNDKSNAAPSSQPDLISPILADALKPLPNLDFGSPQTGTAAVLDSQKAVPSEEPALPPTLSSAEADDSDHTPRGAPITSQTEEEVGPEKVGTAQFIKGTDEQTSKAKVETHSSQPGRSSEREKSEGPQKSPQKAKVSLHPSLPPKPVVAMDPTAKRGPRKPAVPAVKMDDAATVEEPPKSGLAESMHAPKHSEPAEMSVTSKESSPEREGLATSMHAPMPSSMSAPSHITTHSTPSFHPTHGRAHTVGRPNGVRMPFSPSHGSFPDGQHPERERGSHRDRINHARTHSSPPTGPGTSTARARAGHTSRPIIARTALSQLARSLGGTPPPKREAATAASAAKE
ncbi:hypothetical protein BD414DRAFT_16680 [Trametes punicea]|nr:hypothetical protein BD414DRAFT_16680 [Trametes punicea]